MYLMIECPLLTSVTPVPSIEHNVEIIQSGDITTFSSAMTAVTAMTVMH